MGEMPIMKLRSNFHLAVCLLAVLLVTSVSALAEGEEVINDSVLESMETVGTGDTLVTVPDYPDYWIAHVEAPEGDADLNTLAAVIMFGFGSVCGLLAGSEVVRKWTL